MKPENPNDLEQRLSRLYAAPVPESFETGWRADIRREESLQTMKKWNGKPMWKRLAPAMCALVLVAGALWTGTMEDNVDYAATEHAVVTSYRSSSGSSNGLNAKYSLMASEPVEYEEASYDMAAGYDMGVTTYGAVQQTERKLVRTANLTIRTNAFDDALDQVQAKLTETGGYIENLYQYGESTRHISLTMRVPSVQLDAFLLSLEGAGKVTDRSESTTDMTTEYYDNEARLNTLYEKRDRLNELLAACEVIPVCPEQLGGLPTPRTPSERVGEKVLAQDGTDVTCAFARGAMEALRLARLTGARLALLKARSPSCGSGEIYDGSFTGRTVPGNGVAAERLAAMGVVIYSEDDLVSITTNIIID